MLADDLKLQNELLHTQLVETKIRYEQYMKEEREKYTALHQQFLNALSERDRWKQGYEDIYKDYGNTVSQHTYHELKMKYDELVEQINSKKMRANFRRDQFVARQEEEKAPPGEQIPQKSNNPYVIDFS